MTADDIIAANPQFQWRHARMQGKDGLIGTGKDGKEFFTLWMGEYVSDVALPLRRGSVRLMLYNLESRQPGKTYATIADDRIAKRFKKMGIPFFADEAGHIHMRVDQAA